MAYLSQKMSRKSPAPSPCGGGTTTHMKFQDPASQSGKDSFFSILESPHSSSGFLFPSAHLFVTQSVYLSAFVQFAVSMTHFPRLHHLSAYLSQPAL